jgi:two-component system chemotaxis sensor kinase CheA
VRVADVALALPTEAVERLVRVPATELRQAEGRRFLATPDGPVPVATLARLLGPPLADRALEGPVPVAQLLVGGRRLAVVVDALEAERELVVRPIARRGGGTLPALAGAALLGDGRVALVLDAGAVVSAGLGAGVAGQVAVAAPPADTRRPCLLVVDDSITTRTLEQSVLEAAGYDVMTAVDGADGWRLLQERGADLVISDVEMPRMDGFALCETVRASKRFAQLPVILVTSLETPEHRARGLEAGADAYVVKSSFDQEALLATVRELLGRGDA